jgi:hypothetical protein
MALIVLQIAALFDFNATVQHTAFKKIKAPFGLPLPKLRPGYLLTVG